MSIRKIWKKQLLACIGFFCVMLALGVVLHRGLFVIFGAIVMSLSAVIAERGTLCPNCRESLFKEVMKPGAHRIECPECKTAITLE